VKGNDKEESKVIERRCEECNGVFPADELTDHFGSVICWHCISSHAQHGSLPSR